MAVLIGAIAEASNIGEFDSLLFEDRPEEVRVNRYNSYDEEGMVSTPDELQPLESISSPVIQPNKPVIVFPDPPVFLNPVFVPSPIASEPQAPENFEQLALTIPTISSPPEIPINQISDSDLSNFKTVESNDDSLAIGVVTGVWRGSVSTPTADEIIKQKRIELVKLAPDLIDYLYRVRADDSKKISFDNNGEIIIQMTPESDPAKLLSELQGLGLRNFSVNGNVISGSIPVWFLERIAQFSSLRFLSPVYDLSSQASTERVTLTEAKIQLNELINQIESGSLTKIGSDLADTLKSTNRYPSIIVNGISPFLTADDTIQLLSELRELGLTDFRFINNGIIASVSFSKLIQVAALPSLRSANNLIIPYLEPFPSASENPEPLAPPSPELALAIENLPDYKPANIGKLAKLSPELAVLFTNNDPDTTAKYSSYIQISGDSVYIEVAADTDPAKLLSDLEALEIRELSAFGRVVGGLIPISELGKVAELSSVRAVNPAYKPVLSPITSQPLASENSEPTSPILTPSEVPDTKQVELPSPANSSLNIQPAPANIVLPSPILPILIRPQVIVIAPKPLSLAEEKIELSKLIEQINSGSFPKLTTDLIDSLKRWDAYSQLIGTGLPTFLTAETDLSTLSSDLKILGLDVTRLYKNGIDVRIPFSKLSQVAILPSLKTLGIYIWNKEGDQIIPEPLDTPYYPPRDPIPVYFPSLVIELRAELYDLVEQINSGKLTKISFNLAKEIGDDANKPDNELQFRQYIHFYALENTDQAKLVSDLKALGIKDFEIHTYGISGLMLMSKLAEVAALSSLRSLGAITDLYKLNFDSGEIVPLLPKDNIVRPVQGDDLNKFSPELADLYLGISSLQVARVLGYSVPEPIRMFVTGHYVIHPLSYTQFDGKNVGIAATANGDPAKLLADLKALGLQNSKLSADGTVTGLISVSELGRVAALSNLNSAGSILSYDRSSVDYDYKLTRPDPLESVVAALKPLTLAEEKIQLSNLVDGIESGAIAKISSDLVDTLKSLDNESALTRNDIYVLAKAKTDINQLISDLKAIGLNQFSFVDGGIGVEIPFSKLSQVNDLSSLRSLGNTFPPFYKVPTNFTPVFPDEQKLQISNLITQAESGLLPKVSDNLVDTLKNFNTDSSFFRETDNIYTFLVPETDINRLLSDLKSLGLNDFQTFSDDGIWGNVSISKLAEVATLPSLKSISSFSFRTIFEVKSIDTSDRYDRAWLSNPNHPYQHPVAGFSDNFGESLDSEPVLLTNSVIPVDLSAINSVSFSENAIADVSNNFSSSFINDFTTDIYYRDPITNQNFMGLNATAQSFQPAVTSQMIGI